MASTTVDFTLTITKEHVNLDYTGDSSAAIVGGSVTLNMNAALTEAADGYLGSQLGTLSVKFTLTPSGGGGSLGDCTSTVTTSGQPTGKAVTIGCSITFPAAIPALYDVTMEILANSYYEGSGTGTAAAVVAVPGYTTGGGWFYFDTGDGEAYRVNFGITASYQDQKKKTGARGNANLIQRREMDLSTLHPSLPAGMADYNLQIKSNSTTLFTIADCAGTKPRTCYSTFSGKATVKAIDRLTGTTYDVGAALGGNVQFQIDVWDGGEPGSSPGVGPDTFAIRVWNASTNIVVLDSLPNSTYDGDKDLNPALNQKQVLINGGNIQVTER